MTRVLNFRIHGMTKVLDSRIRGNDKGKVKKSYIILIVILNLSSLFAVDKVYLNDNWQLRRVGDSVWYPATVPGTVHTDLYNNGLIPDPFYRDN